MFHRCVHLFSAWCLPPHCAVLCSPRRGEQNTYNSFLARLIKPYKVYSSRFIFFFAKMCGTISGHDPLTPACLRSRLQLHVRQPPGARASGENPGQPPGGGEGLLQQRAMSAVAPPLTQTLPWHSHKLDPPIPPPPLCQPPLPLIQCAKVKFVSPHPQQSGWTNQSVMRRYAFVNVIVGFIVTDEEEFPMTGPGEKLKLCSGPCKVFLFKWTFYPCSISQSVSCRSLATTKSSSLSSAAIWFLICVILNSFRFCQISTLPHGQVHPPPDSVSVACAITSFHLIVHVAKWVIFMLPLNILWLIWATLLKCDAWMVATTDWPTRCYLKFS